MRLQLSLWLTLIAVSLVAACSLSPTEKDPATPVRANATLPAQVTPASTPELGKLAFVKGGDIWVKEIPDGEATQLTKDGGVR